MSSKAPEEPVQLSVSALDMARTLAAEMNTARSVFSSDPPTFQSCLSCLSFLSFPASSPYVPQYLNKKTKLTFSGVMLYVAMPIRS